LAELLNEPNIGLLREAIDLHVHVGPDMVERLLDSVQLAEQGRAVGMRGFALKSHYVPTAPLAALTRRLVPEVEAVGCLALNNSVGGLNPSAVEASLKLGAGIIWMPTTSARNHVEYYGRVRHPLLALEPLEGSISVLRSSGELLPECMEILGMIAEHGAVLATGHLSVPEVEVLVEEARRQGVEGIIVTHPLDRMTGMGPEAQRRMAGRGAFLEHTWLSAMPIWRVTSPEAIAEAVRAVGADRCILTTDFGQAHHPSPVEGLRFFARTLLEFGIDEPSIRRMICDNPHRLLGLEKRDAGKDED